MSGLLLLGYVVLLWIFVGVICLFMVCQVMEAESLSVWLRWFVSGLVVATFIGVTLAIAKHYELITAVHQVGLVSGPALTRSFEILAGY
jgi:hypothetical protein